VNNMALKVAIPDLISNSYFPAIAAAELGIFKREGLDASIELISPTEDAYAALRDGSVDFVASSAHSTLTAFSGWRGAKILCAQSQGMYWFLVMRTGLAKGRGDLSVVKDCRIGAAPLPGLGLRQLLIEAGIEPERDGITIFPVPGSEGRHTSFGVTAAKALAEGVIDGFWANGMAAEIATRTGAGELVLDVRRGDGPPTAFNFTMPVVVTTEKLIERDPELAAGAVRAIVATQAALKKDPYSATDLANRIFPEREASYIGSLVERDAPYYDASVSEAFVEGMSSFCRAVGLLDNDVGYSEVVAEEFRHLWKP
jgi:NitT/TauT family transport system substrate-binding protein